MKNNYLPLHLGLAVLISACSLATEFASMDAPFISDFSPAAEFVSSQEAESISLRFSKGMNALSVERAFSLQTEGRPVEGVFSWSSGNRSLSFSPLAPFFGAKSFVLEISRSAEDLYGNSLDRDFRHIFHTREEMDRPRVLSVEPAPENPVAAGEPIRIFFSKAMEKASTASAFSLSPTTPGFFSWDDEDRILVFHPQGEYRPGEIYRGRIGASAGDFWGNSLGEEVNFVFIASGEPWKLKSVETYPQGEILSAADSGDFLAPHPEIEKEQIFLLRFEGSVPSEDRRYLVNLVPTSSFRLLWEESGNVARLQFSQPLSWGEIYELKIQDELRRFKVNSEKSRPPFISGLTFFPETEDPDTPGQDLGFAHNILLPHSSEVIFIVEVSHGQDSLIPLASFLSSFSLSTGIGAQHCEPYRVEQSSLEQDISLFRVFCRTGPGNRPGILRLEIGKELRDSRDNHLQEDFILILNIL